MRVQAISTAFAMLMFPGLASAQPTAAGQPEKKEIAPEGPPPVRHWLNTLYNAKPEIPKTLEELLAKALKNNPDIRVAESKVREAEAQLNKTRLDVMQKSIRLYHDFEAYRALVKSAQATLDEKVRLHKTGVLSAAELRAAQLALQQAKANLAKLEADLPFVIGSHSVTTANVAFSPDGRRLFYEDRTGRVVLWDAATGMRLDGSNFYPPALALVQRKPATDKVRELLNTPVQGDVTVKKLLTALREKLKGTNLHTEAFDRVGENPDWSRKLHLSAPIPLGAALQWLEDTTGFRLVVRDYGIVLSQRLPPGAVALLDVWQSPADKKPK